MSFCMTSVACIRAFHSVLVLAPLLLLGACATSPVSDHEPLALTLPAQWRSPLTAPGGVSPSPAWHDLGDAELNQLIQTAHKHSPDLAAAVARVQQADATARGVGVALLPAVGATLSANRQSRLGGQADVTGTGVTAALAASYELDFWGRQRAEHRSALALRQASAHDHGTVQITLTAAVAQAWLQLVGGRERLAIASLNLQSAERVMALVDARARAGAATALDLARQRGLVATQRQTLEALRQQVQGHHTALAMLLGQTELPPVQSSVLPPLPPVLWDTGRPVDLLVRRPDIARAEARLAAAHADVSAARAALLPRISLSASLATGGSGLGRLLDNPLYSLAAALAAPIFDAGRLAAGQDLAQARRAELLAQYRTAIVAAVGDVELALQAVAGTQLQQMAQADVVEQAQQAAILAQARYRAGAETLLTLLDAQRTLYAAQDVAAQLRLAAWADRVALHRAVGGDWANADADAQIRADVAAPPSGGSVQVFAGPRP